MTREAVLTKLYSDESIDKAINKMEPDHLREDLKQEIFLVLCEMDEEKLLNIYNKGHMNFFIVRTMLNMIKSKTSHFYFKFRNFIEYNHTKEQPYIEYEEAQAIDLDKCFGKTRQELYERDMLLYYTYTFDKSALKLSEATKIPYVTVLRTIKIAKCKVKSYLSQRQ